jgi:AraC family transcriptional regulator of adaptative response/methylated-DNA-[protein]-cysteine methyltransferase
MNEQQSINYNRIADAIHYIQSNYKQQPGLDEVADKVHLSPHYFQKLFKDWAGVSPKKFLQYISIQNAKEMLIKERTTLFEVAAETGLSGTSRLHDLFIRIEGMTPGEYKNGGENLEINYSYAHSPFGEILVASTQKGICHMAFIDDHHKALDQLRASYPNARYNQVVDVIQQNALFIFTREWDKLNDIKLHLRGTRFQLKVWEMLLKVPLGHLSTYGTIANAIDKPKASRAVGTAIGSNPVAYLIPCHRVIQATGKLGGYMWGETRKTAIIGWEASKNSI